MVEAVVEYDYSAQEADELTIRKGDVIRDIVKRPGGWWEGTLREKRGMFPDNFVTVIVKQRSKPGRAHVIRQCRALFSYHPAHDDELSLGVGDIIEVLGEVEEGWWRGKIGDQEGVFPSNFVVEIDPNKAKHTGSKEDLTAPVNENDMVSPNLPPKPSKIICQVKYGYEACNDDELTLKEGDLITLISKDGQDPGWWRGELNGKVGVFPDNFVTVIPSAEVNGPSSHPHGASPPITIPNTHKSESRSPMTVQTDKPSNNSSGNVAAQRKSLDLKTVSSSPPIPGKKPSVPKKSPNAAQQPVTGSSPSPSSGGGVMAGLRKLVDMVDGAASSRLKLHDDKEKEKEKEKETYTELSKDNEFDHVERGSMLGDMRQNRAKRPQGRRPPSQLYPKEGDMVNGNGSIIDLNQSDDHQGANDSDSNVSATANNEDEHMEERKPKVREWEKNKAPWMAELKQNQAKRISVPTPQTTNVSKTPEKIEQSPPIEEITPKSSTKDIKAPIKIELDKTPPIDMSKSMSSLTTNKKPSDNNNEVVTLRSKTPQPSTNIIPTRPQSIHATSPGNMNTENIKTSPLVPKPPVADKSNITTSPRTSVNVVAIDRKLDYVPMSKYNELLDRMTQMETRMNQRLSELQGQVDDLEGRLKVESDLRRHFQVELEKVAQCVTQV